MVTLANKRPISADGWRSGNRFEFATTPPRRSTRSRRRRILRPRRDIPRRPPPDIGDDRAPALASGLLRAAPTSFRGSRAYCSPPLGPLSVWRRRRGLQWRLRRRPFIEREAHPPVGPEPPFPGGIPQTSSPERTWRPSAPSPASSPLQSASKNGKTTRTGLTRGENPKSLDRLTVSSLKGLGEAESGGQGPFGNSFDPESRQPQNPKLFEGLRIVPEYVGGE